MIEVFLFIAVVPLWAIGALTVFHWFKSPKVPMDSSNRINNIVAWWLGLTRPEVLARHYDFFKNDVMENVEGVQRVREKIIHESKDDFIKRMESDLDEVFNAEEVKRDKEISDLQSAVFSGSLTDEELDNAMCRIQELFDEQLEFYRRQAK